MKRILILLVCSFSILIIACNNGQNKGALSHKDSLLINQLSTFQEQLREPGFQLYPTKNIYTFLELCTATGQIWIVQWSTKSGERFRYVLDDNIRVKKEDAICGRFSLHATENMYNFILLDNISGDCWQVQWSFDEKERMVLPIY